MGSGQRTGYRRVQRRVRCRSCSVQRRRVRVKVVRVRQTCFACPSQWDAWDENGTYLYLRYRYGSGTVSLDVGSDRMQEISRFTYGDSLGSIITLETFCDQAGLQLADRVEYLT